MAPYKAILLVFLTAIATVVAGFLVNGTLVPFLNEINYTDATDVSFYVHASALQVLTRIPISILLGYVSSVIGSVHTLAISFLVAIVGILLLLFSRASAALFLVAYLLSSILFSVRVLRVAIISDLVTPRSRTTLLALHQLMNPVAKLLGPLCWIQIQRWTGHVPLVSGFIVLDRFSLSHLSAITVLFCAFLVTLFYLSRVEDGTGTEPNSSNTSRNLQESVPLHQETSRTGISNTDYATLLIEMPPEDTPNFSFFLSLNILGRISTAIAEISFQPILVDIFLVSDAGLGRIYLISACISFGFPLISAILSRYLRDRELLLIGMLLKFIGNLLYLPIFGSIGKWQLVTAYVLTFRTAMFQTAALSCYTKSVQDRASRRRGIANLNAGLNASGALVRLLVARRILRIFNSWWFSIFTVPIFLALYLIYVNWDSLSANEYARGAAHFDRKNGESATTSRSG